MKVVIDTNVFISCIGKKSPWRNVFDAFLKGQLQLCLSSEILLEYEEKFHQCWGEEVSSNLLGVLLTAPNTSLHDIFYNFLLVSGDADDNKFADACISAEADFLISNDNAIHKLNGIPFPQVTVLTLQEFSAKLAGD